MKFNCKLVAIRRFFELFVTNVILSLLIVFANIGGLLDTREQLSLILITGTVVFLYINVRMLRNCYFDLEGESVYYSSNVIACLLYALTSVLTYLFASNEIYTWVFMLTKSVKYLILQGSELLSICIFHVICFLPISIAPIGMKKYINEKLEYERMLADD